ncbi:MAG: efflux transporter periplasmic adaptor subunit, partial [Chlorobiaceae bacterium]|nr:efflux transporter periplasmic adaptor subunit [Chlorobiaceae bacterium]
MIPKSKTGRILLGASIAVVLLILLMLRPASLMVDASRSSYGPLEVILEEEGVTRVTDRFFLSAPVSGVVLRSTLAEGDSVRVGTGVAMILPPGQNSREYREAALLAGSASASVQEAQAHERLLGVRLAQARLKSARYEKLYQEGAVSQESRELAAEEHSVLEKELLAASAALRSVRLQASAAEARIDKGLVGSPVHVLSPVEGRVLRLLEKNEKVVLAGTPLVEIGNPRLLEVVIDVLSTDAVRVR